MAGTTVAADPFSAFASSAGKGVGDGVGKAIASLFGADDTKMATSVSTDARSFMDGSGWTVSTGGSKATAGTSGGASMGEGFTNSTAAASTTESLLGFITSPLGLAVFGGLLFVIMRRGH